MAIKPKFDPADWETKTRTDAPEGEYTMMITKVYFNTSQDGSFPRYTVLMNHIGENATKFNGARTTLFLPTDDRPGMGKKLALFLQAVGVTADDVADGDVELGNEGEDAAVTIKGDLVNLRQVVRARLTTEEYNGKTRSVAAYVVPEK